MKFRVQGRWRTTHEDVPCILCRCYYFISCILHTWQVVCVIFLSAADFSLIMQPSVIQSCNGWLVINVYFSAAISLCIVVCQLPKVIVEETAVGLQSWVGQECGMGCQPWRHGYQPVLWLWWTSGVYWLVSNASFLWTYYYFTKNLRICQHFHDSGFYLDSTPYFAWIRLHGFTTWYKYWLSAQDPALKQLIQADFNWHCHRCKKSRLWSI